MYGHLTVGSTPAGMVTEAKERIIQKVWPRQKDENEERKIDVSLIRDLLSQFKINSGPLSTSRSLRSTGAKEFFSFNDLGGLGSSPAALRASLKDYWGSEPQGLAINHETYYDAVQPPITEQYAYWCYKFSGEYDLIPRGVSDGGQVVGGSQYASNYSEAEAVVTVSVIGSWEKSDSWSSSITTGMTYESSVGIEGLLTIGGSFSVGVTAGQSSSQKETTSVTQTVQVKVPPKKKCKVSIIAQMKTESTDFTVPIKVEGYVGSNFKKTVNDHYFWFNQIQTVVPNQNGVLSGTIKSVRALDAQSIVGAFEDL